MDLIIQAKFMLQFDKYLPGNGSGKGQLEIIASLSPTLTDQKEAE